MISRYSSRRDNLDETLLTQKLKEAISYDRIAGYFSSSILEVAGEAIEELSGKIRVICNSELDIKDVKTAQLAQQAIRKEWCAFEPEKIGTSAKRFEKLYHLLKQRKMEVRVIPNSRFGLIHGKAGVITQANGQKTAFIGSVNESYRAWKINYEIAWMDDSLEGTNWVQEEFDALWNDPFATPLSDFVIEDIQRILHRKVIPNVEDWKKAPNPASTIVEAPIYRRELGLWEHQKYFINLVFQDHQKSYGARYVLADSVGLGKTVQLALSAQLMALYGDKPIIIFVPKTLLYQWQEELFNLLALPSAIWVDGYWMDENGVKYPGLDESDIKRCPRRIGIVSQGLIVADSKVVPYLLSLEYECVIVDEAHRARRENLGKEKENEKPIPKKLMKFLLALSLKTKSMLLATATPVQLYPIEAWDLLNILSQKNDSVLGNRFSMWRVNSKKALALISGKEGILPDDSECWEWFRNPFPPALENEQTIGVLRRSLGLEENEFVVPYEVYEEISLPNKERLKRVFEDNFFTQLNPFIRHIVRRTRQYLEETINPETKEPYLKKVSVKLMGDKDSEAIPLTAYLKQAYQCAEEFSELLAKRNKASKFIKTLLLKRVGSTMIAGELTAKSMLQNWNNDICEENNEVENLKKDWETSIKHLTTEERQCLQRFVAILAENKTNDPKYELTYHLLVHEGWLERGCIIFSQYYDSVNWIAQKLSKTLTEEMIGVYAGGTKSGIWRNQIYQSQSKQELQKLVQNGKIRILIGTDSASEGLNLQRLGSLINLDLPWNPTRLEQRKGRIQRPGQIHNEVWIYNMRYKGSVEDQTHMVLSERFNEIYDIFGQIPDVLEDVWINVALKDIAEAKTIIASIPDKHPFEIRYNNKMEKIDWEQCSEVLNDEEKRKKLLNGWKH